MRVSRPAVEPLTTLFKVMLAPSPPLPPLPPMEEPPAPPAPPVAMAVTQTLAPVLDDPCAVTMAAAPAPPV
jgi:hypothetical protein